MQKLTALKAREIADVHNKLTHSLDSILMRVEESAMQGQFSVKVIWPSGDTEWIRGKLEGLGYTLLEDEILW
jgi:hypothetical protein